MPVLFAATARKAFRAGVLTRLLLPLPLLLLGGCNNLSALFGQPQAPPPSVPLPPVRTDQTTQASRSDGLAPLPTPQQVLTSVPFGRPDPFAPLVSMVPAGTAAGGAGGTSRPAPAVAPEGFVLNGVLRGGRGPEALVTYGGNSGSLRPGDRGGSGKLLPAGWSLAAIAFGGSSPLDPPSITLLRGGQRVRVSL